MYITHAIEIIHPSINVSNQGFRIQACAASNSLGDIGGCSKLSQSQFLLTQNQYID